MEVIGLFKDAASLEKIHIWFPHPFYPLPQGGGAVNGNYYIPEDGGAGSSGFPAFFRGICIRTYPMIARITKLM